MSDHEKRLIELARLVREMRFAQNVYFRTRTQQALADAKRTERLVDLTVDEIIRNARHQR